MRVRLLSGSSCVKRLRLIHKRNGTEDGRDEEVMKKIDEGKRSKEGMRSRMRRSANARILQRKYQ